MFNFGWAELMVIAVVALIVIGPEDLPDMFRQLGRFTAKLRSMSREFSRAMEQAAKESGVKDVAKDLRGITSPKAMGLDAVKGAVDKFEKWDPIKNAVKPAMPMANPTLSAAQALVPPPMPATPAAPDTDDLAEAGDDLADHAESIADAPIQADLIATQPVDPVHGPATQALYDKQAARAAVLAEQAAKLKAIEDGTYDTLYAAADPIAPPDFLPPPKRATKPRSAASDAAPTPRKSSKKADPA